MGDQPGTEVYRAEDGEGIVAFEVKEHASVKHKGDLIGNATSITYAFATPKAREDIVEAHALVSEAARRLAHREIEQSLAEHQNRQPAGAAGSSTPASPGGPSQAAPANPQPQTQTVGEVQWAVGQRPKGKGELRYVTSASLPTDKFLGKIAAGVREHGDDPDDFNIYDNRVGDYGLESGNDNWSVAAVKPKDGTYAAGLPKMQTQKGNVKTAYYVDFNDDGSLWVRPSGDYQSILEAKKIAATGQQSLDQGQPQAPPPSSDDVPFS